MKLHTVMPNDQQLKDDVERELRWEPCVHGVQIGVSVKDGVVELDGHVPSYYEKWVAERSALRVANVKAIASEIKVALPDEANRTDEDIARTAIEHLSWNAWIPGTIKVNVTDGWVTLSGSVEWRYQSEEAERAIRLLRGVKGVTDNVEVKPKVNSSLNFVSHSDIKRSI
jgi:osmotically-inducible protein OsmY